MRSSSPLNENEVEEKIIKAVAETMKIDQNKISKQCNFVDDLGADSLDQVELMMAIEEAFGCDIPDSDASKIHTIADAVKYVIDNQGAEKTSNISA